MKKTMLAIRRNKKKTSWYKYGEAAIPLLAFQGVLPWHFGEGSFPTGS